MEVLISKGANIHTVDRYGQTVLFRAVTIGHFDIVKMLIALGAEVITVDNIGESALYRAASHGFPLII